MRIPVCEDTIEFFDEGISMSNTIKNEEVMQV
jgi:hypothetical protein